MEEDQKTNFFEKQSTMLADGSDFNMFAKSEVTRESQAESSSRLTFKRLSKKLGVTPKQFKFIYEKKIETSLEDPLQMKFTEIKLFLDAYIFFKFMKNSN